MLWKSFLQPKTAIPSRGKVDEFLPAHGLLLGLLPLRLLLFLLQKLLLLIRTHSAQLAIALLLLELIACFSPLERFLFIIDLLDLANLFFTRLTDFAQRFGAEVGAGDELIWDAEEVGEELCGCWAGGESGMEFNALLGDEFVESVGMLVVSIRVFTRWGLTSWAHQQACPRQ